jgi:hypothetical protein
MTKTKLSILEIYNLRQELEGGAIQTEEGLQIPVSPALITFFKDLRLRYWLQKLSDTLQTESERFEKIKKTHFKETFGETPADEELKPILADGTPNEKFNTFQAKIEELAQEIVEIEHYPFNDGHLDKLKTTFHCIVSEDGKTQSIIPSEDLTGRYTNQEFTPQLFLRKIVQPCI